MHSLAIKKCFSLIALVGSVSAAAVVVRTPASSLAARQTYPDFNDIFGTIIAIDQKSGAADTSAPPSDEAPPTAVTAKDGDILVSSTRKREEVRREEVKREEVKRIPEEVRREEVKRGVMDNFDLVFSGTGTGPNDRDGSIQGTAYLTYTLIPNNTYNVEACLDFCERVNGCVFANLFYEFNNDRLDFVDGTNLKCAVYADVHSAAEKTNMGGQQLYPPPGGLTYIQQSSGYAAKYLTSPNPPSGYELVFGPTNGANNAPNYMGFVLLDRYDVDACATQCNGRAYDQNSGPCVYFNIWRALVNGNPQSYVCSMYFTASDASTATNYGQGSLVVTFSRGYSRIV